MVSSGPSVQHDASSESTFDSLLLELARGPQDRADLDDSAAWIASTLQHYRIQALLGRGGMGSVFLAHDEKLERQVALKLLRRVPSCGGDDAILREARCAAAVVHPNVAAIFDVKTHEGLSFIVMEYVQGSTLRALIPPGGFGWDIAWHYAWQLAEGLNAAHRLGIVHRDLKPENVMVCDSGRLKILDFGLAAGSTQAASSAAPEGLPDV